jgi:glycosyltransferase involved in cell wall biosynthesis
MKVLVSAYACEPAAGSEPAVGWNWVREVAQFCEVWVLTRTNNRDAIESCPEGVPKSAHFVYLDLPRWLSFWKKGRRGVHGYYCLWQVLAYFVARRLHRGVRFDLVHQLTLGSSWLPTFLWLLPAPLVWGPIGIGSPAPRGYRGEFSSRGKLSEGLRGLVGAVMRFEPVHRATEARAAVILATSPGTLRSFDERVRPKVVLFPQVGLDPTEMPGRAPARRSGLRLISVGRLVHWKGMSVGVRAFAKLQERCGNCEYWIVGEGPESERLKRLAASLGVASSVRFVGAVSRPSYLQLVAECDVLLHPSVHEPGAFAIVEAMAAGVPVVCMDMGEPSLLVTAETGFRIDARESSQAIGQIVDACENLARDRSGCRRMGAAARRRALTLFSWRRKASQMRRVYELAVREGHRAAGRTRMNSAEVPSMGEHARSARGRRGRGRQPPEPAA